MNSRGLAGFLRYGLGLYDDCGHGHDYMMERHWLRTALAAAGNPACRLREVLALCEACDGSCGTELWGGGFCGEVVVRTILTELIDAVLLEEHAKRARN